MVTRGIFESDESLLGLERDTVSISHVGCFSLKMLINVVLIVPVAPKTTTLDTGADGKAVMLLNGYCVVRFMSRARSIQACGTMKVFDCSYLPEQLDNNASSMKFPPMTFVEWSREQKAVIRQ